MDSVRIRNVGNKGIYESYMGILRISPSDVDGKTVDSMTEAFLNPFTDSTTQRKIILSDSDGIQLGMYFTAYVRDTKVLDTEGNEIKAKVVNVSTNVDNNVFVVNDYHIRSTLEANKKGQTDKIAPIQSYYQSPYYADTNDVIGYPIESPCDETYFNVGNRHNLIDYNDTTTSIRDQLHNSLYNKDREWYEKNIPEKDRVKVNGKYIYTRNYKNEQVPIVYTKEYILGHYNGHSAYVNDKIKEKYLGEDVVKNANVNEKSAFTKLSFLPLDESIWRIVEDSLEGYTRHTEGRFTQLGINMNETISPRLFGTVNPPSRSSYLLGLSMPHGIIMYHAMPFRRWMFHACRQQLNNARDEKNNYANLDANKNTGLKDAFNRGVITPINKNDPGFINVLTREFVLCNGYEINYDNYPYANTYNEDLYVIEKGNPKRVNGKPQVRGDLQGIYAAIKNSNPFTNAKLKGKFMTPSLLVLESPSPRYLRGLTWYREDGVDEPLDLKANGVKEGMFQNNTFVFEVVEGDENSYTEKNHPSPGPGRFSLDWKSSPVRHYHLCFAYTDSFNRENSNGSEIGGDSDPKEEYRNLTIEMYTMKGGGTVEAKRYPCFNNGWDIGGGGEPFLNPTREVIDDGEGKTHEVDVAPPSWDGFGKDVGWNTEDENDDPLVGDDKFADGVGGCLCYGEAAEGTYIADDSPLYPDGAAYKHGFTNDGSPPIENQFVYTSTAKHMFHADHYLRLTRPSTWSSYKGEGTRDAQALFDYSFRKPTNNAPNSWYKHMPVPCAGLFAWKMNDKKQMSNTFTSRLDDQTTGFINNASTERISKDAAKRMQQLTTMNYAEGSYPIASKGGANLQLVTHEGTCKNRHVSHGQLHYYHHGFGADICGPHSGGYNFQKVIGNDQGVIPTDVPRCVTSLPVSNIYGKANGAEEGQKQHMGDQELEYFNSLSTPPSMVFLPLLKL